MEPHYPLFYTFHFYLFGVIALASALAFVTRKSPGRRGAVAREYDVLALGAFRSS